MSILDKIVAAKRTEIESRRQRTPETALERQLSHAPPARDFRAALEVPGTIQVIAEVKKASPSAGVLRADFDAVAIARIYADHGAAAISVLTDEPFFQGRLEDLSAIRKAVAAPVLRKDFLLERYQLLEARVAGADAILLIAEVLEGPALERMLRESHALGMEALVEFYDRENLDRVLDSGARIVGVNNRNLRTFETRLEHTLEVAAAIAERCCLVSESGISRHEDVLRLQAAGVRAVLVGEALMRAHDIGRKLDDLREG
jgi:indole-3-glycerol phosphate synthase